MNARIQVLERMARRWEYGGGSRQEDWEYAAKLNLRDYSGFQAIQWADSTRHVHWVVPRQGNERAVDFFLGGDPRQAKALEAARATGTTTLSEVVDLVVGGTGFVAYVPVFPAGGFDGFVVGVFRADTLFKAILGPEIAAGYGLGIVDGGQELYRRHATGDFPGAQWVRETDVTLGNERWRIAVWPAEATLASARTLLPEAVLFSGILMAVLLGLATRLARVARLRARDAQVASHSLEARILERERAEAALARERDLAFQVTSTMGQGLATADPQGRFEYVNPALARMLGYAAEEMLGRTTSDFAFPEDQVVLARQEAERATGMNGSYETRLRNAEGEEVTVYITAVPRQEGKRVTGSIAVISNLTQRKRMEDTLRESEERFRRLADATLEAIVIHDDGLILDTNESAYRMFGYAPHELVGRSILDLTTSEWHPEVMRHAQTGDETMYEAVGLRKDGSLFPAEVQGRTMPFGGRTVRVTAVRDITERQEAEEVLRQTNEMLRALIDAAPLAIQALDAQGNVTLWNRAAEHIFGWSAAEVVSRPNPLVAPSQQEEHRMLRERVLRGGSFTGVELSRRTKAGEFIDVSLSTAPLYDSSGKVGGIMAVLEDISARKQSEAALLESEHRYKQLVENASDLIYRVDRRGCFTFVNGMATRTMGYTEEELLGKHFTEVVAPEEREELSDFYARRIEEQTPTSYREFAAQARDGREIWVGQNVQPVIEGGRVVGLQAVARDITTQRETERIKNEFVSVVGHELRTPLTALRGSLGLLASGRLGTLEDRGQRLLEIATQNTDRLVRLINDILDLERLDSGRAALEKRDCDAAELLMQAVETVRGAADEANVSLVCACEPLLPVSMDPDRIVQVLVNLLGNAIKFSPCGGTVRLSAGSREDGILFEVGDEGRGIPVDKLESIFGRFQQVDSSDSRQRGGTGLGLAISRNIVEQHGGRIWAESEPGRGSTFRFTLPAPVTLEGTPSSDGRSARVLLVEDDPDLARVLMDTLERQGLETHHAPGSGEAIRIAERLAPDLLVLDLVLPDGDGYAVVNWLRSHEALRLLPTLVYSAREVEPADRDRLRLGRTEFLTKTRITPEQLEARVAALLGREVASNGGSEPCLQTFCETVP